MIIENESYVVGRHSLAAINECLGGLGKHTITKRTRRIDSGDSQETCYIEISPEQFNRLVAMGMKSIEKSING
jgi:hypothetical protein